MTEIISPELRSQLLLLQETLTKLLNMKSPATTSKNANLAKTRLKSLLTKVELIRPLVHVASLRDPCQLCRRHETAASLARCGHKLCYHCTGEAFLFGAAKCKIDGCNMTSNKTIPANDV